MGRRCEPMAKLLFDGWECYFLPHGIWKDQYRLIQNVKWKGRGTNKSLYAYWFMMNKTMMARWRWAQRAPRKYHELHEANNGRSRLTDQHNGNSSETDRIYLTGAKSRSICTNRTIKVQIWSGMRTNLLTIMLAMIKQARNNRHAGTAGAANIVNAPNYLNKDDRNSSRKCLGTCHYFIDIFQIPSERIVRYKLCNDYVVCTWVSPWQRSPPTEIPPIHITTWTCPKSDARSGLRTRAS